MRKHNPQTYGFHPSIAWSLIYLEAKTHIELREIIFQNSEKA